MTESDAATLLTTATRLLGRMETLLDRLDPLLPTPPTAPDWQHALACRWRTQPGRLQAVLHPHQTRLADLQGIERQKALLDRNTRQFLLGLPANNALLWGAKGTGKSSLIKALLSTHAERGLRLIEVDKHDLIDLPDIVEGCRDLPWRFLVYCDDLSFEADDARYKALKSVLDGTIGAPPPNVLLYATSNRRHLLPEFHRDNQDSRLVEGELHHGEAVEEKISLSERFGLWVSFHPFNQDAYLAIVDHWLRQFHQADTQQNPEAREAALQWALLRGSRSGRAAWQFARDWAGSQGLGESKT